jgi:hypothetical protein
MSELTHVPSELVIGREDTIEDVVSKLLVRDLLVERPVGAEKAEAHSMRHRIFIKPVDAAIEVRVDSREIKFARTYQAPVSIDAAKAIAKMFATSYENRI